MDYIKINPADNVAVALQDLSKGAVVEGVTLSMDIPRGHKIVLRDLKAGENVSVPSTAAALSPSRVAFPRWPT